MSANEEARPLATASAPEKLDTGTVSAPTTAVNCEIIRLLQIIIEQLDQIDQSLANNGGMLDEIKTRMP